MKDPENPITVVEFLDKVSALKGRHIRQRLEQLPDPDQIEEMEMAETPGNTTLGNKILYDTRDNIYTSLRKL